LSNESPYCVELVSNTGVCKNGEAVFVVEARSNVSALDHLAAALLNKFCCSPETEPVVPFSTTAFKLLSLEIAFNWVFPDANWSTSRALRSLVNKEVPGDFRSLNRNDKLSLENLVENRDIGDGDKTSLVVVKSLDHARFVKFFFDHLLFSANLKGFLNCFASFSADSSEFLDGKLA